MLLAWSSAADLRLVIAHTRQGVRFIPGIGFCVWTFHTRDNGYDLLRGLGSASCDITHETGGTICYGHWVLGVRIISRDRGCDLLRALGSVSCDITHETSGTICYGLWVLRLVISHTRQGYDLLRALGSACGDLTHETGGTICCGHWVLHLLGGKIDECLYCNFSCEA